MSEASAVQNPMIKYAAHIGWEIVPPADALRLRDGDRGLYFTEVLEAQLLRLNPGIVDAGRAAEIIRRLRLLPASIEGNREALAWMRGERSVFVPEENRERNVRLIDFDDPEANVFHVTPEWRQRSTVYTNRADVVFLINGLPVAIAETKAADKPDGIAVGIDQIRRYHRETPELFIASQVFEVTQLWDFYYGATWSTSRKNLFNWRDEVPEDYERRVKAFFDRPRFLKMLRDYIIFLSRDDVLTKIVLRQHQTRAVEKVIERVYDPTKRHGLIWHTQGSGKTLTMITIASRLLRDVRGSEKPTVLMLVDRNELEAQLFKNIAAYGIGTVEVAQNKRDLQRILISDYRGLVVSMIHKFDDIPEEINPRDSVIVLVDEAHRSTGGDLGNYLMGALPNATYIGFTGTPIDRLSSGKGTFKTFGTDDERGYLDKYSIAESVEDGTTVRLNYALAPSNLLVDRETLEKEFLKLAEAQGVSDVEELNAILDRAVHLKEMMKAPGRVDRVAAYVARHFRENVERMGFKAFLVAVDREACALYKEALDKYLPTEYSEVVYSPGHNDAEQLKRHHLTPDQEKDIRKRFARKDQLPKILIVTEKLLTGFDAPILYCMYLDKPMRDHVLLQAIARVNRPYEDEDGLVKPYGFVLDFVGIFERLEDALAFDADVVASVIQNIDVLKELFATMMREQARAYLPLTRGWDDKAKERAVTHFAQKETREAFYKFFRQLQILYDILSPDAALRPYVEDYQALATLYGLVRSAYNRVYVDKELTEKTKELLRAHARSDAFELPGAIHELGPEELALLKKGDASATTKILNLRQILGRLVADESATKPFLLSIGERAEALAQAYEDRVRATKGALDEFEQQQKVAQEFQARFERLAEEYVGADAERRQMGVDENTFAIYTTLKATGNEPTVAQAQEVNALFERHPDYTWNERERSRLRTALYQVLRPVMEVQKMIEVTNVLLRLQRV
ncbi:MAG: HsdR family type I site-specific deoxyribonuclease [Ardenticatenaceae bacterium]|nr:HsdR family type I site-specific deoxyribonuclease [Ardenticatenaceae bacterium]